MGEFWNGYITNNTRFTASAAHISGRNIVGAEAFTAQPHYGSFANTPFSLKRWGDLTFTEGLTLEYPPLIRTPTLRRVEAGFYPLPIRHPFRAP